MDTNMLMIGGAIAGVALLVIGVVAFIRHRNKKKNVPDEIYPMW